MNFSLKTRLTGHKSSIYAMAVAMTPTSCFSADGNGWVVYWQDVAQDDGIAIAQVPANVFSLCYLPDVALLAAGSMPGILYAIDLLKPKEVPKAIQFRAAVFALQSYKGHLLAGTGDGSIYVIDVHEWKTVKVCPISDKSIRQIALHPTLPIAAVACSDSIVYVLALDTLQVIKTLSFHRQAVFSVCFSATGDYLFSGSRDAQLAIWQVTPNFALYHTIPAHLFTINAIVCSADGQYFLTGSRDKTIKIWNAQTFQLQCVIDPAKPYMTAHIHSVNSLLYLPESAYFLSASDDKSILVWKMGESGT